MSNWKIKLNAVPTGHQKDWLHNILGHTFIYVALGLFFYCVFIITIVIFVVEQLIRILADENI